MEGAAVRSEWVATPLIAAVPRCSVQCASQPQQPAASSSSKTTRHQCWLAATHLRGHPAPGWPRRQSAAGTLHTPPRPRCAGTPPAGQGGEKLLRLAGGRRQRRAGREAAAHHQEVSLRHHLALVRHAVELSCPTGLPAGRGGSDQRVSRLCLPGWVSAMPGPCEGDDAGEAGIDPAQCVPGWRPTRLVRGRRFGTCQSSEPASSTPAISTCQTKGGR